MSRSGYSDENEDNTLGLWRGNIDRATCGKRGQVFFRELALALDAMPVKRLVKGELETDDGEVCSLGALRKAKGVALDPLIECDWDELGEAFNVAPMLTQEVMYHNDERGDFDYETQRYRDAEETPEQRWARMRKWAAEQIIVTPEELTPLQPGSEEG